MIFICEKTEKKDPWIMWDGARGGWVVGLGCPTYGGVGRPYLGLPRPSFLHGISYDVFYFKIKHILLHIYVKNL